MIAGKPGWGQGRCLGSRVFSNNSVKSEQEPQTEGSPCYPLRMETHRAEGRKAIVIRRPGQYIMHVPGDSESYMVPAEPESSFLLAGCSLC